MQTLKFSSLMLAAIFVASITGIAAGASLDVINPGFEEPGGYYFIPTGWTCSPGCNGYPSELGDQLHSIEGDYAAHTEAYGSFNQTIGNHLIQPETQYTLEVFVGGRTDVGGGFAGSRIELFDKTDGIILGSEEILRSTPGRPDGTWTKSTATFSTDSNTAVIGHELEIRLFGTLEVGSGYYQTWFDKVSVSAVPVPEPSAFLLLGIGVGSVFFARWMKKRGN